MSVNSRLFLEDTEEEYYRERNYIDIDEMQRERDLWQFINSEDKLNFVPLQDSKITLYSSKEELDQLNLVL